MRTKIGKRIGPVPIALVAVFALAAFISAGVWLVPSSGQMVEAQSAAGIPRVEIDINEWIRRRTPDTRVRLRTSAFSRIRWKRLFADLLRSPPDR